jgi:hypothetical protein
MINYEQLSDRIDNAFGSLLMAKDILDRVIPESEHEPSRELAGHLAMELIDLAFRQLYPGNQDRLTETITSLASRQ